ncbi:hypothetical protein E4T38_08330 [Aureobasidium subglaciale]|nr:hypothetical protein E4T38_08330 [Aureobasidium subglaciale]KAI5213507.1 hypothetical protein E4T40_09657 [Aureobasidium subglaciale]KAI5215176.1 hypothetical protein E4T41_09695 [Aureobasidium subglaciale]KAI5256457.1 hypothetical protein E4T46_08230 [Aureobasidium subglaciale]
MLLFPPSSIKEPLRDNTNRKDFARSTGSWKSASRKSGHFTDLAISEVGSSDASIYNASKAPSCVSDSSDTDLHHPFARTLTSDHGIQSVYARAKTEGLTQHDMVQFVNRPHGTPLSTIAEQKSLATLRAQISFASLTRRRPAHLGNTPSGKRKAASTDDTVRSKTRRRSSRDTELSSSLDVPNTRSDPAHPLQPAFVPPHRVKTPEGIPRWPVDNHTSFVRRISRTLDSARSMSLGNGTRLVLRTLRGELRSRRSVQLHRWRPPVSGHSTYRYDQPFEHPLNSVPIAEVIQPGENEQDELPSSSIPEPTLAVRQSLDRRCRSWSSSATSAQRALGAIDGNVIPINPASAVRARSVPVPRRFRSTEAEPTKRVTDGDIVWPVQRPEPYPSDTLRTTELIENFPSPPTKRSAKTRSKLQPFLPLPQGSMTTQLGDNMTRETEVDGASTIPRMNVGSVSTPPLRGEQGRYTLSGMPIYRDDAASLRSHDRSKLNRISDIESLDNHSISVGESMVAAGAPRDGPLTVLPAAAHTKISPTTIATRLDSVVGDFIPEQEYGIVNMNAEISGVRSCPTRTINPPTVSGQSERAIASTREGRAGERQVRRFWSTNTREGCTRARPEHERVEFVHWIEQACLCRSEDEGSNAGPRPRAVRLSQV